MNERINNKPIVCVDMDGVLFDFDGRVLKRLSEVAPHIEKRPRQNFYIEDDYSEEEGKVIRELLDQEDFFASLEPLDCAVHGIKRIIEAGYSPRILSSPLKTNSACIEGKQESIRKHLVPKLGEEILKTAIFSSEKHLHEGLCLIDDKPGIKNSNEAAWKHIIFDQPYNKTHEEAAFRLYGWEDEKLEEILEELNKERIDRSR